uniref:Uncharacterized protein n=1 Tax=Globodera rostochiensis TaxID=31243 RepID=A0A914I9Q6_GLORO
MAAQLFPLPLSPAARKAMSEAAFGVLGALGGCIGCMVSVESLAKEDPSAMNLMTFATFLFISLEGFLFTTQFFTVKNKIPIQGYLPVVITFFVVNVINNQALNFHVPVPLHIIFRSGSLLTSLLMNRFLLGRKYPLKKYLAVFAITLGIILCTLATSNMEKKIESVLSLEEAEKHYREWALGVLMLSAALLISSYLAICQERMYKEYGKHPREAMFYTHAVSLPLFALMGGDIARSARRFSSAPAALFVGLSLPLSGLWLRLLASCVLQWLCILFVYRLNASIDSLSVTLVVTLRKFLSLLISIFWFQNPFTFTHWIGALFVFGGTLAFSENGTFLRAFAAFRHCAAAVGFGRKQSAGAEGTLTCGGQPEVGVKVKLYDDDRGVDTDDFMGETITDSKGHFRLEGFTHEFTSIDPKINIYHDCHDGGKPCQRKISIMIPDKYIASGEHPETYYDAGTIELEGKFSGETRDSLIDVWVNKM